MTSTEDAILTTGNINIDGAGSVNATSTGFDAINAGGDLAIKVRATSTPRVHRMASGQTAISRLTTAEPSPPGLPRTRVLEPTRTSPIKGGGTVEASSADGEALWAATISTSRTAARSRQAPRKTLPSRPRGSLAATNASLNVNGVEYGVYAHKGITLDHANVTVRASKGRYGGANALFTYQDDIVVKNGSTVDARLRKARFRLHSPPETIDPTRRAATSTSATPLSRP